jgi:uncharacterized membrane protein
MHLFHTVMEAAALIIDVAASLIMVWAFLVAVYAFVQASFGGAAAERIMRLQVARCDLGVKLVFALELLIISDLLHTVVSHTLDDLWFLAALVIIRTVISYFLNREIQEVEAEIQR